MYIDSQCLAVVVGANSSLTVLAQVQDFGLGTGLYVLHHVIVTSNEYR